MSFERQLTRIHGSYVDSSRHSLMPQTMSASPNSPLISNRYNKKVIINVGGVRHETYKTTLKNIPDTRLSWLIDTAADNQDHDPVTGEFFFDRHPGVFSMILNYYRTGRLHAPMNICGPLFEEELAYWGIDEKEIEPCCWATYRTHRNAQETLAEFDGTNDDALTNDDDDDDDECIDVAQRFGIIEERVSKEKNAWRKRKTKLWRLLDDPKSFVAAKVFAIISVIFIVVSISVFCLETNSSFRYSIHPNATLQNLGVREMEKQTRPLQFLVITEYVCLTFFTCEIISRLLCCPHIVDYIKQPFNWIDFLSIIPFYIGLLVSSLNSNLESSDSIHFLNSLRLIRIFRIFKLTRHVSGLKILGHTLKASAKELLLLILVLVIGVLIFACLIYYAEQVEEGENNSFKDIPRGFWWALVTMTTLGYGDMYPRTALGYIVGTICTVSGILMLSLPVPVIVNNFTLYYAHAQTRMQLPRKQKKALIGAANVLKEQEHFQNESTCMGENSASGSCGSCVSVEDRRSSDSALESYESNRSDSPQKDKYGISVIFVDEIMNDRVFSSTKDHDHKDTPQHRHIDAVSKTFSRSSRRSKRRVSPTVTTVHPAASRRISLFPYCIPDHGT